MTIVDAAACAGNTARACARFIRSCGLTPDPLDALDVTDRFFRQLELHGFLPDDLHSQARYFASFLVLIEEAMLETPEAPQ
jgi:hypothetical protein